MPKNLYTVLMIVLVLHPRVTVSTTLETVQALTDAILYFLSLVFFLHFSKVLTLRKGCTSRPEEVSSETIHGSAVIAFQKQILHLMV